MAQRLSIILSFRNEEGNIPELLRRLRSTLNQIPELEHELIFVNDASTDNSLMMLMEEARQDRRVKIVNMSRRFGGYPCIMAGFKHATGDALVYMDSDLQDPPELIAEMVATWRAGADVVNTTRTKRLGENPIKMWITRRAYEIIDWMADIKILHDTGDFKLLSRRVIDEIVKLDEHANFMKGIVYWVGFRQETVYYVREARFHGKTKFSLFGGAPARAFVDGVISFSTVPLHFALFFGFLCSIGSFLYMGWVIAAKFMGLNLPGWSALMVAILFIGGVILFTIGVLGIYLGKTFEHSKGRPLYIVESRINFDEPPSPPPAS